MSGRLTVREGRGFSVLAVLFALLMVTSLVAAVPVASAAQEQEPNDSLDTAQSINTGETITGSTPTEDDEDWFAFTAQRGETINVTGFVAAGNDPDKIRLYTRDGDKIAGTRIKDSPESIGTTARYTGTYYVQVVYDFGDPSDYSFTVETFATDDYEPNEGFTNATRISPNTTQSGETPIGDDDWFTFEAEAGETINLTGSVPAGDDPDKMRIYTTRGARTGNWMTEARISGGETQSIGITARYTGTYYVRVLYDFGSPSQYNFTLKTYRTEAFEPNEDRANATQLFENPFTPAQAQLSIGDRDYFKYDLAAGETFRVEAGVAPAVREHQLRLFRPDGDLGNRTKIAGGTVEIGELTAQSSGTHYIELRQGDGFFTGGYNVTITAGGETVGPPNDRFETANPPVGNQNRQNATPIDSGTYGNLGMVDDDRDVLRFRAAQDARVVANVSYDTSANDLSLSLTDATGATVATGGDGLATNVSAAGTYYLRVTGQEGAEATYALELNVSATGPGALPGQANAPTDIDGDGRYEDVNGDGGLNVIDVSILLGAFDRLSSAEVPFYDFNDDGQLNILDVAALLGQT